MKQETQNTEHSPLEQKMLFWVENYGKSLLYGFLGVFVLAILFFRIGGGNRLPENVYQQARVHLTEWQKEGPSSETETFQALCTVLKRKPELHPNYDGKIAQGLIQAQDTEEALSFALPVLERNEEQALSLYSDFSKTTLLIEQGQYEAALEEALSLKEKILEQRADSLPGVSEDRLHAFNLLRLAALQKQCQQSEGEAQTWTEWQAFISDPTSPYPGGTISAGALKELSTLFRNGESSLSDYVAYRENKLTLLTTK